MTTPDGKPKIRSTTYKLRVSDQMFSLIAHNMFLRAIETRKFSGFGQLISAMLDDAPKFLAEATTDQLSSICQEMEIKGLITLYLSLSHMDVKRLNTVTESVKIRLNRRINIPDALAILLRLAIARTDSDVQLDQSLW